MFGTTKNIWIDRDTLLALPTTGPAWDRLAQDATGNWGTANISDQDSGHDVFTLSGALYAVRTNDPAMRSKVVKAIESAIGTEDGGRTLALGRNLTGYVLAADLVGHRSNRLTEWLRTVRSEELGGRTLISTHEDRPNNWGSHAGAARIAADRFLGDDDDLARAVAVFAGFLGDRSAYAGFKFGDDEWQADPSAPVPINPAGATKHGIDVDGAIVDDVRRCECPVASPAPHENYQWEGMQGIVVQAQLLQAAGHDAWSWSDAAIRRAVDFLYQQAKFPAEGDDTFLTYLIDANLGTSYSNGVDDRSGKSIGYTGWTHSQPAAPQRTASPSIVTIPPSTTTATIPPSTTTATIPPSTTTATIPPSTTTATTIATTTTTTTIPVATLSTTPPAKRSSSTSAASGASLIAGLATGSYEDTWSRGAGSHTVVEQESAWRRHDLAELRWTIPAIGGDQVLDVVITVGPDSGDLDDGFSVEWSSNGSDWAPIALVASDTTLDFSVEIGRPTADVHVRVIDPDRSRRERLPDWVSVDFLQIRNLG